MFKFNQVGKEIKSWAKVLAVIVFVLFAIVGVLLYNRLSTHYAALRLLVFAVIAAVGYVIARLSAMTLYGFGELVDKMMDAESRLARMEKGTYSQNSAEITARTSEAVVAKPTSAANAVKDKHGVIASPVTVDFLRVRCPLCNTVQMKNNSKCTGCGATLTIGK